MWSSPNWPSPRAASRRHAPASSTQNSSSNLTDPPIREPPHRRGPAAYSPEHKAARAHGQGPVRPRQEATQRARLAAESPRELAGPTGRPPRSVAAPRDVPNKDVSGAELSPRNLPVGVAIAIGPSPRKPGSSSSQSLFRRRHRRYSRAAVPYAVVAAVISGQEPVAHKIRTLKPSKSSQASRCLREPHTFVRRGQCMRLRVTLLSAAALGLNAQLKKTAHPQRTPLMAAAPPPPGPLDYSHSHPCVRWFR